MQAYKAQRVHFKQFTKILKFSLQIKLIDLILVNRTMLQSKMHSLA